MQSHHIKPPMSIAVSKPPFDRLLVDSRKPNLLQSTYRGVLAYVHNYSLSLFAEPRLVALCPFTSPEVLIQALQAAPSVLLLVLLLWLMKMDVSLPDVVFKNRTKPLHLKA